MSGNIYDIYCYILRAKNAGSIIVDVDVDVGDIYNLHVHRIHATIEVQTVLTDYLLLLEISLRNSIEFPMAIAYFIFFSS